MANDYIIATLALLAIGFVIGSVVGWYRQLFLRTHIERLEGMVFNVTTVLTNHVSSSRTVSRDIKQLLEHVEMQLQGHTKASRWGGADPVRKPDDAVFYREEDLKPALPASKRRRKRRAPKGDGMIPPHPKGD